MKQTFLKYGYLMLILIFQYSCIENKEKTDKQIDTIKNSVTESPSEYDLERGKMVENAANEKKNFKINLQKKAYNFVCYDKCDIKQPEKMVTIDDDIKKYGIRKLYKVSRSVLNDSLIIKFSLIDDCCLEYIGDVEKKGDTLKLKFKNIGIDFCRCYCDYNYQYSLPFSKYQSRYILLGDSLIQQ